MAYNRQARRDGARQLIEGKALLNWAESGGDETPVLSKTKHYVLLSDHLYGSGCCGWSHYIKIEDENRTLAIYRVRHMYGSSVRRLRRVPIDVVEGTAPTLEDFYKWEDEQYALHAKERAAAAAAVVARLRDASVKPQPVDDDLQALLDEMAD
ncbi:hypothetical protein [Methylobacterium sp. CM6247]